MIHPTSLHWRRITRGVHTQETLLREGVHVRDRLFRNKKEAMSVYVQVHSTISSGLSRTPPLKLKREAGVTFRIWTGYRLHISQAE